MEKLKNIVDNMTETPSDNCWSLLEQQLNAAMPGSSSGTEAANNTFATEAASATKSVVATGVSKGAVTWMVAGALTVATAVGGISWALLSSDKNSGENLSAADAKMVVVQDSTVQDREDFVELSETSAVEAMPTSTSEGASSEQSAQADPMALQPTSEISAPVAAPASEPSSPAPAAAPSQSPSQSPTPSPSAPQTPIAPAAPSVETTAQPAQPAEPVETPEEPAVKLVIPNVFTPNGDGINDQFVVENIEYCSESRLIIRNAKGNVIFDKLDYQNDWTGDGFPDGVYFYVLTYKLNGDTRTVRGNISIKRGY